MCAGSFSQIVNTHDPLRTPLRASADIPNAMNQLSFRTWFIRGEFVRGVLQLLFLFLVTISASAQRYVELSAELEIMSIETRRRSASLPAETISSRTNHRSISFVCIVSTNMWELEGNFIKGTKVKWAFDGTNVCNSLQVIKHSDEGLTTASNEFLRPFTAPSGWGKSNITINIGMTLGGYPEAEAGVNIPWLAFCSGTYLKRPGRLIPFPAAIIGHAPDVFAYSDRTEPFADELGLPRKIEFYTSSSLYEASAREFWPDIKDVPRQSLPDGSLKFHYEVTQATNFLGWHLPLRFEFGQDIPNTDNGYSSKIIGHGWVSMIRERTRLNGVFDQSLSQTVIDWRFKHPTKAVDAIIYSSTGALVLPTNDPALQARFAAQVQRAQTKPSRAGRPIPLVVALVSSVLLLPLLIFWLLSRPNSKRPRET